MKKLLLYTMLCVAAVGVVLLGGPVQAQDNVPRMTKEDLKPLMGSPDVIIIDVRSMGDWQKDTLMINGAVREDPVDVSSWVDKYPKDKTLVFYCA
jgi:rhodanese-related sulfurtransferase